MTPIDVTSTLCGHMIRIKQIIKFLLTEQQASERESEEEERAEEKDNNDSKSNNNDNNNKDVNNCFCVCVRAGMKHTSECVQSPMYVCVGGY